MYAEPFYIISKEVRGIMLDLNLQEIGLIAFFVLLEFGLCIVPLARKNVCRVSREKLVNHTRNYRSYATDEDISIKSRE